MRFDRDQYHRRSIRLQNYDYSKDGMYFVTLCTRYRLCLFGEIELDKMILNEFGEIANNCWLKIPEHFKNVVLHEHVIMPDHMHGILEITKSMKNHSQGTNKIQCFRSPSKTIGSIIRGYKIGVIKSIKQLVGANQHSPLTPNKNKNIPSNQHSPLTPNKNKNIPSNQNSSLTPKKNIPLNDFELLSNSYSKINPSQYANNVLVDMSQLANPNSKNMVDVPHRENRANVDSPLQDFQTIEINIWQRDYYDSIIRNQKSFIAITNYIRSNPANWKKNELKKVLMDF